MWRSLVSAPALGAGGRRFESGHPDQLRAHVDLDETHMGATLGAMCYRPGWPTARAAGYGEDSIYFDHASDCRDGQPSRLPWPLARSISLGFGADGRRIRKKVTAGPRPRSRTSSSFSTTSSQGISLARYTVERAVDGLAGTWPRWPVGQDGLTNREVLAPLTALIGRREASGLTATESGRRLHSWPPAAPPETVR